MKTKKILLWGASPELPKNEDFKTSFARSGENFGNTLIGNGVVSVLKNCEYIYRHELKTPEEANERCDHIVIPAANFLWKGFDFGFMSDFIEATTLPVTIIGLGAQTSDRSQVATIHPNTLRLMKILSERSPALGVRGFYTAEVLAAHGILNLEVLGCPSLYSNLQPPKQIIPIAIEGFKNLAVNFSRRVAPHSFMPLRLQEIENKLLEIAIRLRMPFIAQDEIEELEISDNCITQDSISTVSKYFSQIDSDEVIGYFSSSTRYFCTFSDWSKFILTRSGTIGSRLHGNIISLINGKPGLVIAHDSRTLELCALTGMPYINIREDGVGSLSEEGLIDRITNTKYDIFCKNMQNLFIKYKHFLEKSDLPNYL